MSALVTSEIFRLFVNTLTPDDKYSRRNFQNFWQQLQTRLSQKRKTFFDFLLHFWNVDYYRNYCIGKRYLLMRLKGLASAHHSLNQSVNGFETLLNSTRHHYFPLFPRSWNKLRWKKSALVTSEIFRLFVNTLTPDDKYSRRNMQIFWQQLQMLLCQEEKTFRRFFIAFPKCAWNFEHSEKEEEYPSLIKPKLFHRKEMFT